MMKKALLLMLSSLLMLTTAFAQERSVSGTVTSSEDESPLPGVNIVVAGTTIGTITDIDGNYKLQLPEGATDLQFSFLGFKTKVVTIGGQSNITITLDNDDELLDEVVITALGLEVNKDKVGTASSSVGGASIANSGSTTPINGLSGKASGVQIVKSSGDPGAGSYIQIRGQSTITGSTQPLIVIDGMPMFNSTIGNGTGNNGGVVQQSRMNDLNPEDIESVEVLKGAAAAAQWGSRAGNGVIMITTKKGSSKKGKINVGLKMSYGMDQLYLTHDLQNTYGQGNGGVYQFAPGGGQSWGDKISDRKGGADDFVKEGAYFIGDQTGTTYYPIANGDAANPHGGKNSTNTYDYKDQLFKTGTTSDVNLSLSGGDADGNFFASISNTKMDGIIKRNSDYERTTLRFNGAKNLSKIIKLSANTTYSKITSNRIQMGSNLSGLYLGGLRSPADFDPTDYSGTYVSGPGAVLQPNRQRAYRNPLGAGDNSVYDNPLWMMENIKDYSEVDRFIVGGEAFFDISKYLTFTGRIGIDHYNDHRQELYPALAAGVNNGGYYFTAEYRETQINQDYFFRGRFDFTNDIGMTYLVGMNFNERIYNALGGSARSFIIADSPPRSVTNAKAENQAPSRFVEDIRTAALYSTLGFDFYDQVFLSLTGRSESSSTFGPAERTFFYPSTTVAWDFTKTLDIQSSTFTFGKLRASYGQVGIQPPYGVTATYYEDANYEESWGSELLASTYNGGYIESVTRGNTQLKPERKTELELGMDLRFFNDRLSFGYTYFDNITEDAILRVSRPGSSGFSFQYDNAATLTNKGHEFDLNWNAVKTASGFSWDIAANMTTYKNMVTSLSGTNSVFLSGFTGTSSRAVEGQPTGVLWGIGWDRNEDGSIKLTEDGFPIAGTSEKVIGDPNPDFMAGINNTFKYKGAYLSFLFDMQQGGDIWAGTEGVLRHFGRSAYTGVESTATTDIKTANGTVIPAGTTFRGRIEDFGGGPVALDQTWFNGNGGGFGPVSEQFIQDASWVKLRELTLGYNLAGKGFTEKTKLSSVDLSFTARNLFIWSAEYTGNDPETNLTGSSNGRGLDYFNNPATRSYMFTLRVNY